MKSLFYILFFTLSVLFLSALSGDVFAQQPEYGQVVAHVYEDSNKNGVKDSNENGVYNFGLRLHNGKDCLLSNGVRWHDSTNQNGDALMGSFSPYIPVGEYSLAPSEFFGWIETSPSCINVQISSIEINTYNFGVFKAPIPNHYTQLDPKWGGQIYDHADSIGPFFCGSTIGECGCAVTAAVALLTSYQVYESPEGEDTTPEVLNNWLKNRPYGYINGGINWLEVAKYAYEANKVHDSPKIDYKERIDFADFETLRTDLDNQKPAILQVNNQGSMHFVLAGSYLNNKFNIHDPLIEDYYTTLDKYSNTFAGMRRYELTNTDLSAILLTIPAPAKIMITDSQGRRLGQDPNTGQIFKEIPGGSYYLESPIGNFNDPNLPQVPEGTGTYFVEILDPSQGPYTIQVSGENKKATFIAYDKDSNDKSATFDVNGSLKVDLHYNPLNIGESNFAKAAQGVQIDYLPGTAKNPIVIQNIPMPMAILGSDSLNVKDIKVDSIVIAKTGKPIKLKGFYLDINRDKKLDLLFFFYPKAAGVTKDDQKICLTAEKTNGDKLEGCDTINVLSKSDSLKESSKEMQDLLKKL